MTDRLERLTDSRQTRLATQRGWGTFQMEHARHKGKRGRRGCVNRRCCCYSSGKWQLAGQLALAVTRQSGSIGSGMHEDMLCFAFVSTIFPPT